MINDVYVDGTIVIDVEHTKFKFKEVTCGCDKETLDHTEILRGIDVKVLSLH